MRGKEKIIFINNLQQVKSKIFSKNKFINVITHISKEIIILKKI